MRKFEITEYVINTNKFPKGFEGFTFVMMSDLHSNEYRIDMSKAKKAIDDAKPDGILIAGDMINGRREDDISEAQEFLEALALKYPVYYGMGNHESRLKNHSDSYGERFFEMKKRLEDKNVIFLENKTVFVEKNHVKAAVTGLEIDEKYYRHSAHEIDDIENYIKPSDSDFFNILIAHNPKYFKAYAKWGADLAVAGHVHGGIIRLPFLGGVISTDVRLFPKYDGGLYRLMDSQMIVGRGMGTHSINLRINNRPELIIIKILAKD